MSEAKSDGGRRCQFHFHRVPTSPPCRRLAWGRLLGATPPAHQDGISPTGPAGSDDVTRALSASSLDGHAPRRSAPGSPLTHPLEHEHCRKPGTKFGGAVRWKRRRRRRSFPVCPRPPGLGIPTGAAAAAAAAAWTSETEFSVRMFRSSSWKKVGQAPINPELKQSGQRSRSISGRRIACPRWRAGRLTYASWFSHLLSRMLLACCLVLDDLTKNKGGPSCVSTTALSSAELEPASSSSNCPRQWSGYRDEHGQGSRQFTRVR